MDIALLKYPKKSHRKSLTLPSKSPELAELMGIVFGDGGINNPWQLVITLNSIADLSYSVYVSKLLKNLFHVEVMQRKRVGMNALVLVCSSTSLVDFLVQKGAVRGNKIVQKIDIPSWIERHPDYERAFVKGLVDTDGCLFIHKHTIKGKIYRNIGLCFTSRSEKLIFSVAKALTKNGIKPYIVAQNSRIYLYSAKAVLRYLNIFGSSNPRIFQKYQEWGEVREWPKRHAWKACVP